MATFVVTVHQRVPGNSDIFEGFSYEGIVSCYTERVNGDRFEFSSLTKPSVVGHPPSGVVASPTYESLSGLRIFKGDEVVAYYPHTLNVSIVREDALVGDEEDD